MKENVIGGTYSIHERNGKYMQQFMTQWEDNFEDIQTDGRITLKCSFPGILLLAYLSSHPCFSSAMIFCSNTLKIMEVN
jgi:hypothetical protein